MADLDFSNLGPYANDWTPRDPSTGGLITMPMSGTTPTLGRAYTPDQAPAASDAAAPPFQFNNVAAPQSSEVVSLYQKYLGRTPSADEIQGAIGHPGGTSGLEQFIATSPEAQAYAKTVGTSPSTNTPVWTQNTPATTTSGDVGSLLANSPLLSPWTVPFSYADFKGPTYTAPTLNDLYTKDPGYQARLETGLRAMDRSAAAKGTLLTGGTVQGENQAAQDYASNEWSNFNQQQQANFGTLYNSQLSDWTTNYNKALQGYQQAYNIYTQNQDRPFNKLASISGVGQTASQQLASTGLGYANAFGNTTTGTANNIGNLYTQAGNANAAGNVGAANAWSNYLGNTANTIQQLYASSYK